jgi:hypothetical protein
VAFSPLVRSDPNVFQTFFKENEKRILKAMEKISRDASIKGVYNALCYDKELKIGIDRLGMNRKALSVWLNEQWKAGKVDIIGKANREVRYRIRKESA